jgi:hypothetical protein
MLAKCLQLELSQSLAVQFQHHLGIIGWNMPQSSTGSLRQASIPGVVGCPCMPLCCAGMPLSSEFKVDLRAAVLNNRLDDFYAKWGNHVVFGFTRGGSARILKGPESELWPAAAQLVSCARSVHYTSTTAHDACRIACACSVQGWSGTDAPPLQNDYHRQYNIKVPPARTHSLKLVVILPKLAIWIL